MNKSQSTGNGQSKPSKKGIDVSPVFISFVIALVLALSAGFYVYLKQQAKKKHTKGDDVSYIMGASKNASLMASSLILLLKEKGNGTFLDVPMLAQGTKTSIKPLE